MGFVNSLRMRNLFPGNSDLGSASIDLGYGDPMAEVINAFNEQQAHQRRLAPRSGIQQVANMNSGGIVNGLPNGGRGGSGMMTPVSSGKDSGLKFGGVVSNDSNPGAEMNQYGGKGARELYESYKKPAQQAEQMGPSNNAIDLENYFKRKNAETVAESNATYKEGRGWKTVTTVDPQDPKKQVSVQVKDGTGEVRPISLPGTVVKPGSAKDVQKQLDTEKQEADSEELLKTHASDALGVLDEISKATGKFDEEGNSIEEMNPNAQNITGKSGNIPPWIMDLSSGNASVRASIDRLKSMLTLDRMQSLKSQSKSGTTGFGSNMNQKEFSTLISSASKLATMNQSEPSYGKELGRVRTLLKKVADGASGKTVTTPNADASGNAGGNGGAVHAGNPPAPVPGYTWVRRSDNTGWTAQKGGK